MHEGAPGSRRSRTGPGNASAHDDDPWRGRDKRLHAGTSAGLGAGFYALSVPLVERRSARAAIGFGVAFSLGIAKELYDATGAGTPALLGATVLAGVLITRRRRHARLAD